MPDAQDLIDRGNQLFGKRASLLTLWDEIACHFYPERADFTTSRSLGVDFAADMTSSYPFLVRRDLGNSLGTMSRPTNIPWFHMGVRDEEATDHAGEMWMEWATTVMRRAMYDRVTQFNRACKEADHDMAAFGQSVKLPSLSMTAEHLLYRSFHLRDTAWCEGPDGRIDTVHRKWKAPARELAKLFPGKCHEKVTQCLTSGRKEPHREFEIRHIVMPTEDFPDAYPGRKLPFVSIYLDVENKHFMEIVGQRTLRYIIPRWQTVSGSQYAFSPATVAGLPDARLLQAMTRTLLEAGEIALRPPMIGVEEAIRGDVPLYAGGITWVDAAYDERLGEVLRPLNTDVRGFSFSTDMSDRVMAMLREAFFLNRLTLPQSGPEMTAYEVGQRVQEYIRQAAPIFEPLEDEDNAAICEETFDIMLHAGAFGSIDDIPQSIRGAEIEFRFESPLHDAIEKQKGQKFIEASGIIAQTVALDPTVVAHLDVTTAFRDVLKAIGMPPKWMRDEADAEAIVAHQQQVLQEQEMLARIQQGAETANVAGQAAQQFQAV